MKKLITLSLLLTSLTLFSEEDFLAPTEPKKAWIWQENGKWFVLLDGHKYTFDYLIHNHDCPCEWWEYDY